LISKWKEENTALIDQADSKTEQDGHADSARSVENNYQEGIAVAEQFLCVLYANFILVVLIRIRSLVLAIGGVYILLLLAVSVYPFEPKMVIRWLLIALLLYIVAIVGLVYAAMHRDPILSMLTDTKPGELGFDFWVRMLSFVALPLFSLVVAQFPEMNSLITSWLEPALQSIK
jgi:hypothetical protein